MKQVMKMPYCHAWWNQWFYCQTWWLRGGQRQSNYYSHEHRNIPKGQDDWIGIEGEVAWNVYAIGIHVRISSAKFVIETHWANSPGDDKNWIKQTDYNLPARHRPNRSQPGYTRTCGRKQHFSYEKKRTCLTGYWHCAWWRRCYWQIHSFPHYIWWWTWWRWNWLSSGTKQRFPRAVRSIRYRFAQSGQKFASQEWQQAAQGHHFGVNWRAVHIRSLKKQDGKPFCLVDAAPFWRGQQRPLLVQKCVDAAEVTDGREIWGIHAYPNQKRWENEHNWLMRAHSDNYPTIQGGSMGDSNTWFEKINENSIHSPNRKKCIAISNKSQDQVCGKNVQAGSSSQKQQKGNHPCNPALKKPKIFRFMPNDERLYLSFRFGPRQTFIKTLEIEFEQPPGKFEVKCQNDRLHRWYSQIFVECKGRRNHLIPFSPEPCNSLVIRILEQDKKKNKCKEGLCLNITKVKFTTEMFFTTNGKCMEFETTEENVRFFDEPARIGTIWTPRWRLARAGKKQDSFHSTMTMVNKMNNRLKILQGGMNTIMGSDISADKNLELERCERGPCMKQVKRPNLPRIYKKLLEVKGRFGSSSIKGAKPGESKSGPAFSCTFAKKLANVTTNGFYWIKNKCSKDPVKIYCNMDTAQPRGFLVENMHEYKGINIINAHNLWKPEYFATVCSKAGFGMTKITTVEDIEIAILTALLYGFTQHRNGGLLFGYDFRCNTHHGCSGKQQSLDGSTLMNTLATKFNTKVGKDFTAIVGNEVLLMHHGQFKTVAHSDAHVNAVLCETIDEWNVTPIGCSVTYSDLMALDSATVICTTDCSRSKYPLQGSSVYSENSSVCKAIMHSGSYKETGGMFFANVVAYKSLVNSFVGAEQNKVSSSPLKKQMNGFTIAALKDDCSEERIKNLKQVSFLESGMGRNNTDRFLAKLLEKTRFHNFDDSDSDDQFNDSDDQLAFRPTNDDQKNKILKYIGGLAKRSEKTDSNEDIDYKELQTKLKQHKYKEQLYKNMIANHNELAQDINLKKGSPKDFNQNSDKEEQIIDSDVPAPRRVDSYIHRNLRENLSRLKAQNLVSDDKDQQFKPSITIRVASKPDRRSRKLQFIKEANTMFKKHEINIQDINFNEMFTPDVDLEGFKKVLPRFQSMLSKDLEVQDKQDFKTTNNRYKRQMKQLQNISTNNPKVAQMFKLSGIKSEWRTTGDNTLDDSDINKDYFSNMRFAKGWKKKYPKHTQDLESDESKNKDYYKRKDESKLTSMLQFKKDGDGSVLSDQFKGNVGGKGKALDVSASRKFKIEFQTFKKKAMAYMALNLSSMEKHEDLITPLVKDFNELNIFALVSVRQANKQLKRAEKAVWLLEDKQLSLFKQVNMDYIVDIVTGVSTPLPDYWLVTNPKTSSEFTTALDVTKQDVSPHSQAIKVKTNPVNTFNDYGMILSTRYHKTFDGSFHFSFKFPDRKTIIGALFRQTDEFTNYSIKFIPAKRIFYIQLNSPFAFKIIFAEKADFLNPNVWLRCVIKFQKYKMIVWVDRELEVLGGEMDPETRKREFKNTKNKFELQDPGLKEGRIGFQCTECSHALFSDIQLQSDKCIVKDTKSSTQPVISKNSARFIESQRGKAEMFFKETIVRGAKPKGAIKFGSVPGKKSGLIFDQPVKQMRYKHGAAHLASYKDFTLVCLNRCIFKTSVSIKGMGTAVIGFKFKNSMNYQAVSLQKSKSRKQIELVQFNSYPKVLTKKRVPDLKEDFWHKVSILVKDDKISLTFNGKSIFKNFKNGQVAKSAGTAMFGVNGLTANFSDIAIRAMWPDAYLKKMAKKKKSDSLNLGGLGGQGQQDGDYDEGEGDESKSGNNDDEAGKEESEDQMCLKNASKDSRMKWCEIEFSETRSNISACVLSFCDICCTNNSKQKLECKNKCSAKTIKTDYPSEYFDKCMDQQQGESDSIKKQSCIICCANLKNDYMSKNSIGECDDRCTRKFPEIAGVAGWGKFSMMNG